MRIKKVMLFLHRWLGFISGLVVFIVSVTGCIFCFQKEISDVIYRKQLLVNPPVHGVTLPISQLKQTAQAALHSPTVSITAYTDPGMAWECMYYKPGNDKAFWVFDTMEAYKSVFINPYTGQITGMRDYKTDFFMVVKYIHWSLLLNTRYGQPIVGYSTLIFVVLLITGLILWWPKNLKRANFNKSFKVKWNASFKRLNYDLHNVLGFYATLVALVLALTGMVMAMQWFNKAVYVVASQSIIPPAFKTFTSDSTAKQIAQPLNVAFKAAWQSFPDAKRIMITPAATTKDVIYAYGYRGKEDFYDWDILRFDQYSGKLLNRENFKDKNNGEKLLTMNYDIHVGAIWGLPGKILAFIASLISASLPVTGLLVWLGKRKKFKRKSNQGSDVQGADSLVQRSTTKISRVYQAGKA
ncbi:PepSY domain-containing protein [Mucilaginibacter robiniae]|uniref:PepSY domain-containing protein n=1 Tax=Mucilaginibacter robiniae TaxID=2728022 RepID=A0A7L5E4W8_9SPHI|nr:PepSY-associated TM helix domain-containing protein [Mucilaginibacter robiniae]QJD97349.1 PepSY domain-containing protein [Mucilaginibacter robiniae]